MSSYAFEHHHTTRECLKHLSSTGKIGAIYAVEGGYVLRDPAKDHAADLFPGIHQAVVVKGSRNVLYTAFGWGYGGEGARGLTLLLHNLGMNKDTAWDFVSDSRFFPEKPDVPEFAGKIGFLSYWQLAVPSWSPSRIRRLS